MTTWDHLCRFSLEDEDRREKTMDDTKKQELATQLAMLRRAVKAHDLEGVQKAFDMMDNSGIFLELDEHTEHADAEDVLQETRAAAQPRKDPAEWGDSSGYTSYGGDHIDGRGATINGPVTVKAVNHGSV